jgi:hypothetical protein
MYFHRFKEEFLKYSILCMSYRFFNFVNIISVYCTCIDNFIIIFILHYISLNLIYSMQF